MHLTQPWLVIVNPTAANGKVQKQWPIIEPRLMELLPLAQIKFSQSIADVLILVEKALRQGIRNIMTVGGDGSVHQLANAIMQQTIVPSKEITISILPLGTGNDWIKTHGIPEKWTAWKSSFVKAKPRFQNVGEINCQKNGKPNKAFFVNVAGMAYDAFVVKYAEGKKTILPGKLYYFWLGISCLFHYATQKATLRFNGEEVSQRFYTINVGICQYSGGGMQFVPHAKPDGDFFGLTYVGHLSRLGVIWNSYRFYKGRIATFAKAKLAKVKQIQIEENSNSPIFIEADGEYLGESPIRIEIIPGALKFIG